MSGRNSRSRSGRSSLPAVLATTPGLLVRLGWAFLQFKSRRRRGVRTFRRTLVGAGMPAPVAARLSDDFASFGRLRGVLPSGLRLSLLFGR